MSSPHIKKKLKGNQMTQNKILINERHGILLAGKVKYYKTVNISNLSF